MDKDICSFKSLTVFVLATNETDLLRKTVAEIRKNCKDDDLEEIIVVAKSERCPGFFEAKKIEEKTVDGKFGIYVQKAKQGIESLSELPHLATGSHFLIMAADMEMDPGNIRTFVKKAKEKPERIVCASKWMKGSVVEGYGRFHAFGSRLMNSTVAFLYGTNAKDLFSLYQIYPVSVYGKLRFENPRNFLYEYTLKPLRAGFEYEEIPTVYKERTAGKSNVNVMSVLKMAFKFCITALRIRFTPKRYLNENK